MSYRVVFTPAALDDLAAVWLAASDRTAIAQETYRIERLLTIDPFAIGESRDSPLVHIIAEKPIGMWYDIVADDEKVIIQAVWLIE